MLYIQYCQFTLGIRRKDLPNSSIERCGQTPGSFSFQHFTAPPEHDRATAASAASAASAAATIDAVSLSLDDVVDTLGTLLLLL
jgi:hypothetical protein